MTAVADFLQKGKQTQHTKVSTKHSLNKVRDTKFVLVKPEYNHIRICYDHTHVYGQK